MHFSFRLVTLANATYLLANMCVLVRPRTPPAKLAYRYMAYKLVHSFCGIIPDLCK